MNPYIWLAIGLPASGKSTWIDENCGVSTTQDIVILGTDRLIDAYAESRGKTYSEVFKEYIDTATDLFFWKLENAVVEGRNVIIDRTNLTKKARHKILARVPDDYTKIALVFSCDDKTLAWRLQNRPGKHIPDFVIDNMRKTFEYPSLDEGFTQIQTITYQRSTP
jgi:predicted kinase